MSSGLFLAAALAIATVVSAHTYWHLLVRPSAVPGINEDADALSPGVLRLLRWASALLVLLFSFALGFAVAWFKALAAVS